MLAEGHCQSSLAKFHCMTAWGSVKRAHARAGLTGTQAVTVKDWGIG